MEIVATLDRNKNNLWRVETKSGEPMKFKDFLNWLSRTNSGQAQVYVHCIFTGAQRLCIYNNGSMVYDSERDIDKFKDFSVLSAHGTVINGKNAIFDSFDIYRVVLRDGVGVFTK